MWEAHTKTYQTQIGKTCQDVPRQSWKTRANTYQQKVGKTYQDTTVENMYTNKTPVARPGVHYKILFRDFGRPNKIMRIYF